jgi:hypothetical protein
MEERQAAYATAADVESDRAIKRPRITVEPQAAPTSTASSLKLKSKTRVGRPATPNRGGNYREIVKPSAAAPQGGILDPIVNSAFRVFRSIGFGGLNPMQSAPSTPTPGSETDTETEASMTTAHSEGKMPPRLTAIADLFAPDVPVAPIAPVAPVRMTLQRQRRERLERTNRLILAREAKRAQEAQEAREAQQIRDAQEARKARQAQHAQEVQQAREAREAEQARQVAAAIPVTPVTATSTSDSAVNVSPSVASGPATTSKVDAGSRKNSMSDTSGLAFGLPDDSTSDSTGLAFGLPDDTTSDSTGLAFGLPDTSMNSNTESSFSASANNADNVESEMPTQMSLDPPTQMSLDVIRVPVYKTTTMAEWNMSDWDEFMKTEHGFTLAMLHDSIKAMEQGQLPEFVERTKRMLWNIRQRANSEVAAEKKGYHARLRHQVIREVEDEKSQRLDEAIKEVEEEKSRLREEAIKELDQEMSLRRAKANVDFEELENGRRESTDAQPSGINPISSAALVDFAAPPSLSAQQLKSYERQKENSSKHLPKNPSHLRKVSRFSNSTVGSPNSNHDSSAIAELVTVDEARHNTFNTNDDHLASTSSAAQVYAPDSPNFPPATQMSASFPNSSPFSVTNGMDISTANGMELSPRVMSGEEFYNELYAISGDDSTMSDIDSSPTNRSGFFASQGQGHSPSHASPGNRSGFFTSQGQGHSPFHASPGNRSGFGTSQGEGHSPFHGNVAAGSHEMELDNMFSSSLDRCPAYLTPAEYHELRQSVLLRVHSDEEYLESLRKTDRSAFFREMEEAEGHKSRFLTEEEYEQVRDGVLNAA